MRVRALDQMREAGEVSVGELADVARRQPAERLQAPRRPARGRHPRPAARRQPGPLLDRRRERDGDLRSRLRQPRAQRRRAQRALAGARHEPAQPTGVAQRAPHRRAGRPPRRLDGHPLPHGPDQLARARRRRSASSRPRSSTPSPAPAGRRAAPSRSRPASMLDDEFGGLSSSALQVVVHSPDQTVTDAALRRHRRRGRARGSRPTSGSRGVIAPARPARSPTTATPSSCRPPRAPTRTTWCAPPTTSRSPLAELGGDDDRRSA